MRTFLKVLAGIVVIIVLGIFAVMFFTADLVQVADDFLIAAREGRMRDAYALTSADFKASTSQERLAAFLKRQGLLGYREASWSSRSIEGGRGALQGTVSTDSGAIPISMGFVKDATGWKIYAIEKPAAGLQTSQGAPSLPDASEQVRLVRDSMRAFGDSVAEGSMVGFRDHVSELWKDQVTAAELDDAFRSVIEARPRLAALKDLTPQFTEPPSIDERGVLSIKGVYPTQPEEVIFEQDYVREGLDWKLIGFSIHFR